MTPAELEAHFANWTPTSENIDALPFPLKNFIMRLRLNTDPAGELQRAMEWEMRAKALEKRIAEAPVFNITDSHHYVIYPEDDLAVDMEDYVNKRWKLLEVDDERG